MAAWSASTPRSESTSNAYPSATAALACRHSSSIASAMPPSPLGSNSVDRVTARRAGSGLCRIRAVSSLSRIGYSMRIWWQDPGSGFSRFRSAPRVELMSVTSSSRMASRGGLVTCAKSCLK